MNTIIARHLDNNVATEYKVKSTQRAAHTELTQKLLMQLTMVLHIKRSHSMHQLRFKTLNQMKQTRSCALSEITRLDNLAELPEYYFYSPLTQ